VHVPGWHEATKNLQQEGELQMVGIIEEQHPDRAKLFMQWKQMGWPILVDSLNLLEMEAVPVTVAIDEYGIIRRLRIPLKEAADFAENFVNQRYQPPAETVLNSATLPDLKQLEAATSSGTAEAWQRYGNALFLWGGPSRIGDAIHVYQKAISMAPQDGRGHFRLGVAYRKRYDSDERQPGDFQLAIQHWKQALDLDPNQYIWRRRIQQYGPRLDKPYSFYDWVRAARKEIKARGEIPIPLVVEPSGAEFAYPSKTIESELTTPAEPDPKGRIHRDNGKFIQIETTVVPPVVAPGEAARFHLEFEPNLRNRAHWNNEVDDLSVWLNPPDGWALNSRDLTFPNPRQPVSQEVRKVEFEAKSSESLSSGLVTIPGYALYYVCEDVNGTCLYRRQDLSLKIRIR
jgi:tetratricopeptide (TPR) repeat protein